MLHSPSGRTSEGEPALRAQRRVCNIGNGEPRGRTRRQQAGESTQGLARAGCCCLGQAGRTQQGPCHLIPAPETLGGVGVDTLPWRSQSLSLANVTSGGFPEAQVRACIGKYPCCVHVLPQSPACHLLCSRRHVQGHPHPTHAEQVCDCTARQLRTSPERLGLLVKRKTEKQVEGRP